MFNLFNLLIRWLFFIAVIWPVRAEADLIKTGPITQGFIETHSIRSNQTIYWTQAYFNQSLLVNKAKNKNICQTRLITQYFTAEDKARQFFLSYLSQHTQNVKLLYMDLNLLLQTKNNQTKWNKDNLGLEHLLDYYDLIYQISDQLTIFFNQLNVCWKTRKLAFTALKKIIQNYRTQEEISAEIINYFYINLNQILGSLQNKNLSKKDKINNLQDFKKLLDHSVQMQAFVSDNYKILSEQLRYIQQIYWGL